MFNIFSNRDKSKYQIAPENSSDLTERWLDDSVSDGQLLVDVYSTDKQIIVKAAMAGVKPEDLNISLHHDFLTIKGKREEEKKSQDPDYIYRECYWGSFSRSLVLPFEVDPKKIQAVLENGVLTIILEKVGAAQNIKITVKE
ncbi:MAG: Hsp20/alpha crystallin family protein [Patescibacteria group bacterium]|jgi:HSP20 family protein